VSVDAEVRLFRVFVPVWGGFGKTHFLLLLHVPGSADEAFTSAWKRLIVPS